MITDLERAYKALSAKTTVYADLWRYYDGDQPVVYTNKHLREIFRNLDARFIENWCAVIVDSVLERVQLTELSIEDEAQQAALDEFWQVNHLGIESDDAHLGALVCGESYIIIWRDDEAAVPDAYYNDPRLVYVQYDPERPHAPLWAAKWWDDDTELGLVRRLTLYYPDRLEYYRAPRRDVTSAAAFVPFGEPPVEANPWGQVPVFHLRTRRTPTSEIQNAIPLQNGINKLLIDMMVSAEYGAMRQRWVISQADIAGQLKNAPNEIWSLPAGDGTTQPTSVGQFEATDLKNYLDAIDNLSAAMAIITRTPRHYFWQRGGDPSGEALITMEAPLNKKALARIERFTPVWADAAALALRMMGFAPDADAVTPVWAPVETVQPLTRAQVRALDTSAGIPLVTALRREGWSETELEQLANDREEARATEAALGERLLSAFDRGQEAI